MTHAIFTEHSAPSFAMKLFIADVMLDVTNIDLRDGKIIITAERVGWYDIDIVPPVDFQLYGSDDMLVVEGDFPHDEPIIVRPDRTSEKPAKLTVTLPLDVVGRATRASGQIT